MRKIWTWFYGDGAVMIIKSAEGRRSRLVKRLPPQEQENQRNQFEKAGIKRVGRMG